MKKLKIRYRKDEVWFGLYFYVMVFSVVNKAFTPFGFDMRYLTIILGIVIIIKTMCNDKVSFILDTNMKLVLLLYVLVGISMFNMQVPIPDRMQYNNLLVLNLYNLFNIFVLGISRKKINLDMSMKALRLSFLFLGTSIFATIFGIKLPFNDYQSVSGAVEMTWVSARYCGYGTDPNYVCLLYGSYILLDTFYEKNIRKLKIEVVISFALMLLSMSRTVLLLYPVVIVVSVWTRKMKEKNKKMFFVILCLALFYTTIIY